MTEIRCTAKEVRDLEAMELDNVPDLTTDDDDECPYDPEQNCSTQFCHGC